MWRASSLARAISSPAGNFAKNKTGAQNLKMTLRITLRQSCSMYLVNFLEDNGLAGIPETSIVEGSIFVKECFVGKVATSVLYWDKVNNVILSWFD